jgi:hypothetical protein
MSKPGLAPCQRLYICQVVYESLFVLVLKSDNMETIRTIDYLSNWKEISLGQHNSIHFVHLHLFGDFIKSDHYDEHNVLLT